MRARKRTRAKSTNEGGGKKKEGDEKKSGSDDDDDHEGDWRGGEVVKDKWE